MYLGNSVNCKEAGQLKFMDKEESDKVKLLTPKSYQVHVACHELLGHGVGKLIYRNADGSVIPVIDPVTGENLNTCYEEGETWNSKFGKISTSFEESEQTLVGGIFAHFLKFIQFSEFKNTK